MATMFSVSTEPTAILATIDFASKGLSKPHIVHYDQSSARLVLHAIYEGPKRGWPALTRESLQEIAGKKASPTETRRFASCAAESDDVAWPLPVTIIITLLPPGPSSEKYLQIIKTHTQLYVNDYRPFQLPVAFWRTAEGIWIVLRDEASVSLPEWWETCVRPSLEESESRWRIASWRRKSSADDSEPPACDGTMTPRANAHRTDIPSSFASREFSKFARPVEDVSGGSVELDEAEVLAVDQGWLPAVEILIQMADILLVRSPWLQSSPKLS
jgi:hypothetical protein